jgi:transposase
VNVTLPPTTIDDAIERLNALTLAVDDLSRENKLLREMVQALRHGLFGRRSERVDPGQLALFEAGTSVTQEAEEPETPPAETKKRKKGHGRAGFSPNLPRIEIVLDVPEDERDCPECGKLMRLIGEDTCERGHFIPARIVVHRYRKQKYACPDGHAVKTAKAPDGVIDKGKHEASVYAHIATSKYADHIPLNRLEGIFKRHGVHLPKQTMWDMLKTVDELVAQPVLAQMRIELLAEPVLHSDETPVTMRLEGGKGTRKGYAWAWRNLREAEKPKVLIEFRENRSRDGPLEFLGKWAGTLIADGYSGFCAVVRQNQIVRAGCMAHARRKVKEALDCGSKVAMRVFRPIQRLFWLERAIKRRAERDSLEYEQFIELRREVRERRSRTVWAWLQAEVRDLGSQRGTLPESKLGKALGYLDLQQGPLSVFLEDSRIPIHNNDTERDLRHLVVGRNNWLVFASPRGGEVACRLYSLVLSCKQNGVDPEAYIEDVLMTVATTPASKIATLTPWGWKAARRADASSD